MNPTDTPRTDASFWKTTVFNSALLEHDGETCNEIFCISRDEAECLVDLLNKKEQALAASKAEVAELNSLMVGWKQRATMSETDLEVSKAEVERLRSILTDHATFLRKNGFDVQANTLDPK
jgi:uncharacterized protein YfdQ (DUF2303 family)